MLEKKIVAKDDIDLTIQQPNDWIFGANAIRKRISDAFDVFDNARSHEVDVRELGTIIRSLGCVISETELQEIQVEVEDVENNCVTQERFVQYMAKAISEQKFKPADPEDLLQAFQLLDPDNHGYIMRADMEKSLMEIGEPFTKEEIDEMMSVACDPIHLSDDENVYKIAEQLEANKTKTPFRQKFMKDFI